MSMNDRERRELAHLELAFEHETRGNFRRTDFGNQTNVPTLNAKINVLAELLGVDFEVEPEQPARLVTKKKKVRK